jgi:hypothetical protein
MSQQLAVAVDTDEQQPQCRICLDGQDPDLGRLIRPCLCRGTVSVSIQQPLQFLHHFIHADPR